MALAANDLPVAERMLRAHLKQIPDDIAALRMLAELRGVSAATRCAYSVGARVDGRAGLHCGALQSRDRILSSTACGRGAVRTGAIAEADPDNPAYRNLNAAVLTAIGDLDAAVADFERALADRPNQPKVWMSYGHPSRRSVDRLTVWRPIAER